jgi:hypothetical protein
MYVTVSASFIPAITLPAIFKLTSVFKQKGKEMEYKTEGNSINKSVG